MIFSHRRTNSNVVGIEIKSSGISLVAFDSSSRRLVHNRVFLSDQDTWPESSLLEAIESLSLASAPCHLVLGSNFYEIFLLEAPAVPEEEMAEALKWRVKDLISYPLDDAIVVSFKLPEDSNRSGRNMVYAVAAERVLVERCVRLIEDSGLRLSSIDIQELAHRNLVERIQGDVRGAAVVSINEGRGNIQLFKGSDLYLTRKFEVNYQGGLFEDLPEDQLTLEIQRSLDYYERQMGQVPPRHIYLTGENISEDKLTEGIKSAIDGEVKVLSIDHQVSLDADVDDTLLQTCIPALGAAFRGTPL